MSLFVINRYGGEQVQESKNEKSHLSSLLKRIEAKKKEREALKKIEDSTIYHKETYKEPELKKQKKKKKPKELESSEVEHKVSDQSTCDNEHAVINDDDQEDNVKSEKSKKSKKRKRKEYDDSLEEELKEDVKDDKTHEETASTESTQEKSQGNDFIVLGSKSHKKNRPVKRVLPDWLAHPEVISADLSSGPSLDSLDSVLDPKLVENLKANGIKKLFPVQEKTIRWLLKCNNDRRLGWWPRDTCVSAPTGSGKTLAYVLPIIQHLQNRLVPKIRCLVVLPVQELAAQVYKIMSTYSSYTTLKVGLISGASSFGQEQETIVKKSGRGEYMHLVDILVATPGRLIDHIFKTPGFSLEHLRFLVIDEADRATDWLQYLPAPHMRAPPLTLENLRNSKVPPAQKLLFSATLSQDPEKLNRLGLFQPILFTSVLVTGKDDDVDLDKVTSNDFVGRYTSPEELTELAVKCAAEYKPLALYHLLTRSDTILKTLVFTNSGETAHRLAILNQSLLSEKKIVVGEISSQLTPKQREDVLNKFIEGKINVLISSDALARGLDIPNVQLVVSYDLTKHIKSYIHRAGRTGRAGKSGTAVSVLTSTQLGLFKHMLSTAHKPVPNIEHLELETIAEEVNYQKHVENLREILEKEKVESLQRLQSSKHKHKYIKKNSLHKTINDDVVKMEQ